MEFSQILYTKDDGVATVTLNRPEALNAITPTLVGEVHAAIEEARRDDEVNVLVLTGAGRGFCAGADLKAMAEDTPGRSLTPNLPPAALLTKGRYGIQRIPRALEALDKPYIAAVNGPAMGGGMDFATMADIRILSDRAKLAMTHVKVANLSMDGGYYFLSRAIGVARAIELVLTSRPIDAEEAFRIGYAHRVVPHDDLMPVTMELAKQLARGAAVTMQLAKRLVYRASESTLDEALEDVEWAMAINASTEDSREGPRAFSEKRQPQYGGR